MQEGRGACAEKFVQVARTLTSASNSQVLLSVYARAGRTGKALEVLEVMQKIGVRLDLSFATWLTSAMLQASGTYISRYSRAEDYHHVLAIWKV